MPTEKPQTQSVQILEECEEITLVELSRICRVHTEWVVELIQEGVVEPLPAQGTQWRFSATSIVRVQKADRLQRDLGPLPLGVGARVRPGRPRHLRRDLRG